MYIITKYCICQSADCGQLQNSSKYRPHNDSTFVEQSHTDIEDHARSIEDPRFYEHYHIRSPRKICLKGMHFVPCRCIKVYLLHMNAPVPEMVRNRGRSLDPVRELGYHPDPVHMFPAGLDRGPYLGFAMLQSDRLPHRSQLRTSPRHGSPGYRPEHPQILHTPRVEGQALGCNPRRPPDVAWDHGSFGHLQYIQSSCTDPTAPAPDVHSYYSSRERQNCAVSNRI